MSILMVLAVSVLLGCASSGVVDDIGEWIAMNLILVGVSMVVVYVLAALIALCPDLS